MKNLLLTLGIIVSIQLGLQAQTEEEAVQAVIDQMFEGMKTGDVELFSATFHETVRLQTVYYDKEGASQITETELEKFIDQIANKPEDHDYDERLGGYTIEVDANLATAWTPYEFYFNGEFSHCGVNAFQFFKSEEGWKITQIIDTRRREGCL